MGQSQSSKFDKLFTLICTDNTEELTRQLRSCSSPEQTSCLSNLSDADKSATLLMYAAFYGNMAICRLLLESGAQLFSRDNEGRNVLFYAIAGQAYNVAKYLIENALTDFDNDTRKNFINNSDNTGETCLHEAVKVHAVSCIELLLKHEIDVNIVNKDGVTALHRAVDLGKCFLIASIVSNIQMNLGHPDIVRLLLKHKAELNTKDASGWTPLHVASAHNDVELVRLLINRGARLNATDNQGHSPLKWARETGSRDVFSYLKSQGGKEFDSSSTSTASTATTAPQRSSKKRKNLTKISSTTTVQDDNPTEKINF
jgi:ankyrin repeat protein